jgi:hypothetical protein
MSGYIRRHAALALPVKGMLENLSAFEVADVARPHPGALELQSPRHPALDLSRETVELVARAVGEIRDARIAWKRTRLVNE